MNLRRSTARSAPRHRFIEGSAAFMLSVFPLFLATVMSASGGEKETITYTKHIAPLLWKNCANCHRPGEVGPFSLVTYQDAAKRADFLAAITAERRMPPW